MSTAPQVPASLAAPRAAWSCAIGATPETPGRSKVTHEAMIYDGPWGGVPLGGLGSGSIGRTPRGDFARWHLETGKHRFESIPACQFSVFTSVRGHTSSHALSTIRPDTLTAWDWDLPVGAGRYHALFPYVVPVWATGGEAIRKIAGALPHDVGGPAEDPFVKLNHYHLQDVNGWKDLNSKFVLLVWQSVSLLDDEDLCRAAWTSVTSALRYLAAFDRNGDGLPKYDGVPDQTYDTWPTRGPSAYGGSLWLASLRAAIAMGGRVGDAATVAWLRDLLDRALPAFDEKLWDGASYRYDAGGDPSSDSVMADQLAGQWWADATGLGAVTPDAHVLTALRTVYKRNVLGFGSGRMGAVNGTRPDGSVDASSEQSQEVWTGTTYALAAFMAGRGMLSEAWATAAGVARVVDERGYQFRTPEAYDVDGNFRASIYLRPLAIWAIEHALRGPRA